MRQFQVLIRSLILCIVFFHLSLKSWAVYDPDKIVTDQDNAPQMNANNQPVYTTSRLVTAKPVIDGKLDDECWNHGTWAGDFHQWIPNEGAPPTYPTKINIQYDDKNIYVAIRAYDDEPE
ncbi:MAG: hypothetical protein GYA71_03110, partial [Bacteroidales bacterium]|nr:hypothetical protein [Bacteroidales bacterium]